MAAAARAASSPRRVSGILKIWAGCAVAGLVFTWPIWQHPTWWGIHDWPQFYAWYEIPRITLLKFHQFPLWNPYLAGGVPELGYPQSGFLSPFFLPVLLFGSVVGLKLCVVLYMVVGMVGMVALTRFLRCHPWTQLLAAGLWGLNGHMAAHLAVGHIDHLTFFLLPWVVLCFLQRKILLTSGLTALLLFSGGPYPFLLCIGFLILLGFSLACLKRTAKPIQELFIIGGLVLGLGAMKLLPLAEFFLQAIPVPPDFSSCGLRTLRDALLSPHFQMQPFFRDRLGSWEYNAYVGKLALGLWALSLFRLNRQGLIFLIPGILSLGLAFGQNDPLGLFPFFQRLPVLGSFHVPFRFIILCLLSLAVVTAIGLTRWLERCPRFSPLLGLLALGVLGELLLVNQAKFNGLFSEPPVADTSSGKFEQLRTAWTLEGLSPQDYVEEPFHRQMFLEFLRGRGTVNAILPMRLRDRTKVVGDPGYRGEVYLEEGPGRAALQFWSPNRLRVSVQTDRLDFLVINQNFALGWRVVHGPIQKVKWMKGVLGVPVPPGEWEIGLSYFPTAVGVGGVITGLTLLLVLWRRFRRTRLTESITRSKSPWVRSGPLGSSSPVRVR